MARRSLVALALSVFLVACAEQGNGTPGPPAFVPPSPTLTAAASVPVTSATPAVPTVASPSGTAEASPFDFRETGTLVRDNPGLPPDQWHLLYERPGAPALTQALILDATSICTAAQVRLSCDTLEPGTRVTVEGNARGDAVHVTTLRVERAP